MRLITFLACFLLASSPACAEGVAISDAWIRLLPGGAPAAGYFQLRNEDGTRLELIGAKSIAFGRAMLHRSVTRNGSTRMVDVSKVAIAPGSSVAFQPGGYHLMLMKPAADVRIGGHVPVTLIFSGGQEVSVIFEVRDPAGR